MIQILADGVLVSDSRQEEYDLQGLRITRALNKGGTAEIVMPPYHPAYSVFTAYRTVVEIYRDGWLKFRGRALYPIDDFDNFRTVVCEGELCFFQDAIIRPYLYQTTPAQIFEDLIGTYNAQVEKFKQFKIGNCDVTDPNDYVRLESENAEPVLSTINKLLERCGGYIVFTTDDTGARVVHWLTSVGNHSEQIIEAGENLFDLSLTGANTDLATALVPYGAKDETTGGRVTIESVNDGKDYIVDEETAAIRGTIMKTVTWDDVTDPQNLLTKAREYLNENRHLITSLKLTALDLSYIDKTVDSYEVGDYIRVISKAHKIDEELQLIEHTEDMVSPENSYVNLGKEIRTLTGLDVAGDDKSMSALQQAASAIKQDFDINAQKSIDKALEGTVEKLTTVIEQRVDGITLEASGSLGSKATITLKSTGGAGSTAELDLTAVRQAFANDHSAVAISAGAITFNSNTLIVNSTNLQVTADGTIKATNAVLSGTATTESGNLKSELSAGRLRFFYAGTEYGGIASGHIVDNEASRGVTVQLSDKASFMGFSRLNSDGTTYSMWYCINFGANIGGRTERHLFFDTSYFSEQMIVDGQVQINNALIVSGQVQINNALTVKGGVTLEGAYSVKYKTSGGEYINGLGLSSNDKLVLGATSYELYLQGPSIYIGQNEDGLVQIQGESAQVMSPFTFYDTALFNSTAIFYGVAAFINNATFNAATTFEQLATYNEAVKYNGNAFFASGKGVAFTTSTGGSVFALNMTNDLLYVGTQDAPVYVYGSTTQLGMSQFPTTITGSSVSIANSVSIAGALTFNNGYGVRIKDTSGTAQYVLSLNTSNQLNVGSTAVPLYLRGTGVTIPSGGLALGQGSIILPNGYGVVICDSTGATHYVISLTSGNMVNVGTASYVTYLRGTAVYLASSGAAVTSDERKKNSIEALPEAYEAMLDKITPIRYKYNDGTSNRYHAGFSAQEVKAALEAAGLTTQDFGGFVDLNGDGEDLGLIYTEFIAILLSKIKRQEQRIAALEAAQ